MKKLILVILAAACSACRLKTQTPTTLTPEGVYNLVVKSTVTIYANNGSQGSGFYVRPNVIATNFHVIAGATEAECEIVDTEKRMNVAGFLAIDEEADLILLQVDGTPQEPLRFAGEVSVAKRIYAIGSPQGMSGSIILLII